MDYVKFDDKLPKERTMIKCVMDGMEIAGKLYGATEWAYFIGIENGILTFAESEKMEYVYPQNEFNYTHWISKHEN